MRILSARTTTQAQARVGTTARASTAAATFARSVAPIIVGSRSMGRLQSAGTRTGQNDAKALKSIVETQRGQRNIWSHTAA